MKFYKWCANDYILNIKLNIKKFQHIYLYVIFKGQEKDFFFSHIKAHRSIYSSDEDFLVDFKI